MPESGVFFFTVVKSFSRVSSSARSKAYLVEDAWDDWFQFSTLYTLIVFDEDDTRHEIGGVKIGQFDMETDQRRPKLPRSFENLNENYFSLGQDDSYYENLNKLGDPIRSYILAGLRDVVADQALFERTLKESVTKTSLLRSVTPTTVRGQFRRLVEGGVRLTRYNFTYNAPRRVGSRKPSLALSFNVEPESHPPTNIHVLIGRNGVGKTYLLNLMTLALVDSEATEKKVGSFEVEQTRVRTRFFANVVSVTFSAFDPFLPLRERRDRTAGIKYSYVGLKSAKSVEESGTPKNPDMLAREFVNSVRQCLVGAKAVRWRRAIEMLTTDPIFKESEVEALAKEDDDDEFKKRATSIIKRMSSGHKIVLLTITRLVETVEERTLVLIDEPEAHLHPPLLSAFIRSLSDLLVNRNGVAIIATHSPVVLQEVPKSCVWKLRRSGLEVKAERPEIETFGENVGVLTHEVFGLEVTKSGFHKLLSEAVRQEDDFDLVIDYFQDELGAEARAITRALISERHRGQGRTPDA